MGTFVLHELAPRICVLSGHIGDPLVPRSRCRSVHLSTSASSEQLRAQGRTLPRFLGIFRSAIPRQHMQIMLYA